MRCSADEEKEILGPLSHGLEHVSAYKASIDGDVPGDGELFLKLAVKQ